jgi:hypothetical protein
MMMIINNDKIKGRDPMIMDYFVNEFLNKYKKLKIIDMLFLFVDR